MKLWAVGTVGLLDILHILKQHLKKGEKESQEEKKGERALFKI